MLVKIEARVLIFPGTDFHFPSTSVPPGTFLGSAQTPSHSEGLLVIEAVREERGDGKAGGEFRPTST